MRFGNNKTYFLETSEAFVAACLNSPVGWFFSWRHFLHLKDEALSNDQVKINVFPIPASTVEQAGIADAAIADLLALKQQISAATYTMVDWLRHEFGIANTPRTLSEPQRLNADSFVDVVRGAMPKSRKWSAAEIARLKQEYAQTVGPARDAATLVLGVERKLSDLANAAYGLTPEEVALMWRTAPPRMPLDPAEELRRLGLS